MPHRENASDVSYWARLNLSSLPLVWWIVHKIARNEENDRPQFSSTNATSTAVVARAKQLAADGRDDSRACAELRVLAKGRVRTLRQAEKASRFLGYHHELRDANLTQRLLHALLTQAAVASIAPCDNERIEVVERFNTLSRNEQWELLTSLEPGLLEIERAARSGSFGKLQPTRTKISELGESSRNSRRDNHNRTPSEIQEARELAVSHLRLMKQLQALIGPECHSDDLLLTSQVALDAARAIVLFHR